ncbi:ATP-dependent RNA helicase DbpA [Salinicola endophyticus]|uniref:ATP-dependent RNA helicase DbpA n=1 Tax=Salinicola endophyticus TaxID=1949083 RepID=UPI001FDA0BAB|nr:ATP-dependent RNA helicase DbpA [Salinicola endophyticus]
MSDTATSTDFSALALTPALKHNLDSLGYHTMTPIQALALPAILAGRDVIGQGRTGSGKTAAFGLGLLQALDITRFEVQALVLCPTRELADQVAEELRRLARQLANVKILTLCGGTPMGPQLNSLAHGAHVVVGTPGRLEAHLRKGALDLDALRVLVLDEADRMLDMGFQETLEAIVAATPRSRQTLLFSATYADAVRPVAERLLRDPVSLSVPETHGQESIHQHFHRIADETARLPALMRLLHHYRPSSSIVFCNTRQETETVAQALAQAGFSAEALHGERDQRERDRLLIRFAQGSLSILVATDVAARGLDIEALDAVFNYQLARELESHVHRVGRTGRAGEQGTACTLVSERETHRLERLAALLAEPPEFEPLPKGGDETPFQPAMATLEIDAGKQQKIRPGDILGALTRGGDDEGIDAGRVGKIKVTDRVAFVAVERELARRALAVLNAGKLKGRRCRARLVVDADGR